MEITTTIAKIFIAEGKKPFRIVDREGSGYFTFNPSEEIKELKQNQIIKIEVDQKTDYKFKKQYELKKLIKIFTTNPKNNIAEARTDDSAASASTNPTNPGQVSKNEGVGKPKQFASIIPTLDAPKPLSDEQIESFMKYANMKATDRIGEDIILDKQYELELFKAKLIQQQQTFSIAMSKYIEKNKLENIKKVQDSIR